MPTFGAVSSAKVDECCLELQSVLVKVIRTYDFAVIEAFRSNERQDELFRQDKSKLRGGESKHNQNPSDAVDIVPYPIDWGDMPRFYLLAGFMFQAAAELNVQLRWGGDWDGDWDHKDQSFFDLVHFEVIR